MEAGLIVFGVDPGLAGALSVFAHGRLRYVRDMPTLEVGGGTVRRKADAAGIAAIVREWRAEFGPDHELAVIERVAAMPKQGSASTFSLGHSAGTVEAVFLALGCPVEFVTPQAWKKAAGVGADKASSIARATMRWPDLSDLWRRKKDDGRAEAALIGWHGWERFA
jgi:crossover junction endodeoxyribonuclease RuvC